MKRPNTITAELKKVDASLMEYVVQLEKANLKLHKEIGKIAAINTSLKNENNALKFLKDPHGDIAKCTKLRSLTEEQLTEKLDQLLNEAKRKSP